MPSSTLNASVVGPGVHNVVLRKALIHSPVDRVASASSYHKIEIGIREGAYTTWIGSWDQSAQYLGGGSPLSVLDEGRDGMRLRAGQTIVVRVTATGVPASIQGTRLTLKFALVGGRIGPEKPLVSSGSIVSDPNSRSALAVLERQINTGGLSEWEDGIDLVDPVPLVVTGSFQGLLQIDSTTQMSLQQYEGNWVEVDGEAVSIGSSGLVVTTAEDTISAIGTDTGAAPSSSTLYYLYLSATGGLALCATAPSLYLGVYYLGSAAPANTWRYCGWAYLNGSTQFATTDYGQRDSV